MATQFTPAEALAGGALIGDSAGFLNVPKIKGSHTAMKSGMIAAEAVFAALEQKDGSAELTAYPEALRQSWVASELNRARNIRPAFRWGLWAGMAYAAIDTYLLRGRAPWTFRHHADHKCLKPAAECPRIEYPKPDGKLTFEFEDRPVHPDAPGTPKHPEAP